MVFSESATDSATITGESPALLLHVLLVGVGTRAWRGTVHAPGHKDHGPSWCKRTGPFPWPSGELIASRLTHRLRLRLAACLFLFLSRRRLLAPVLRNNCTAGSSAKILTMHICLCPPGGLGTMEMGGTPRTFRGVSTSSICALEGNCSLNVPWKGTVLSICTLKWCCSYDLHSVVVLLCFSSCCFVSVIRSVRFVYQLGRRFDALLLCTVFCYGHSYVYTFSLCSVLPVRRQVMW